jgi:OmpR-family two-component system manganese-sensing sensor histidine kinase
MEVIEEQQLVAAEKGIKLSLDFGLPILDRGLIEDENPKSQIPNPKFEEDTFAVEGDWDQLARLFTNLVSNALQYTPAGGKVDVELQWVDAMNRLPTKRHGMPYLQVRVSDTGIGIPESALPHIFDRFYRVDPARTHIAGNATATGSGLGLAIAQAIVETHQGHIQIESLLHQGTTVTVTLPAATEEY